MGKKKKGGRKGHLKKSGSPIKKKKVEEKENSDPDSRMVQKIVCECGAEFKRSGGDYHGSRSHICDPKRKKAIKNLKSKKKAALKIDVAADLSYDANGDVAADLSYDADGGDVAADLSYDADYDEA